MSILYVAIQNIKTREGSFRVLPAFIHYSTPSAR